jgi:hypothetical protein
MNKAYEKGRRLRAFACECRERSMLDINPFKKKVITDIRDEKGRIIVQTTYQGGWYSTIANHYND